MKSQINFADEKIKDLFYSLKDSKDEDKKLYFWIVKAFEELEKNAFCGIQIPKRLIPKEYLVKYNIDNLWKYNLPGAWRLIYSVSSGKVCVITIILEWMKHKDYEKKFKY